MARDIIKLKGIIGKVVRVNGKAEAQMIVTIPVSAASELPLGEVLITIEETQISMFPKGKLIKGGKSADSREE